jgi:hypothetical protein
MVSVVMVAVWVLSIDPVASGRVPSGAMVVPV